MALHRFGAMSNRIRRALYKSLFGVVLVLVVYWLYPFEIIRSQIEDLAFERFNQSHLNQTEKATNSPMVIILSIDDGYLKRNRLEKYGYLFPRDHLARIINGVDKRQKKLQQTGDGIGGLLLDYDLEYSTLPYGQALSTQDEEFIRTLDHPRTYPLLIPKLGGPSRLAKEGVASHSRLVSVNLLRDKDGAARRWQPYFEQEGRTYLYGPLWLWLRHQQPECMNTLEQPLPHPSATSLVVCGRTFIAQDLIQYRIIYRDWKAYDVNTPWRENYWERLISVSADQLDSLTDETLRSAFLLVGADHK